MAGRAHGCALLKPGTPTVLRALLILLALTPQNARCAETQNLEIFAGTWYEIARTDHAFERNLTNTAAECTVTGDGTLILSTRGLNGRTNRWTRITARARPGEGPRIEIMFLGFFAVPYRILSVDGECAYALIASENLEKMWFLSREKSVSDDIFEKYVSIARELRVSTDNLIRVAQAE